MLASRISVRCESEKREMGGERKVAGEGKGRRYVEDAFDVVYWRSLSSSNTIPLRL